MRDKWQEEATRTLRACGFVPIKLPDYHFDSRGKKVYPNPGRPDTFFAGRGHHGGFVEVKTGRGEHHQRFDFKEWREDQRTWYYQEALPYQASYWLFIVLGERVNGKEYPRIAMLITAERLLQIEQQANKKSLSYEEAVNLDGGHWLLTWAGDNIWDVPAKHPFAKKHIQQEKKYVRLSRGFRSISRCRDQTSRRRSREQDAFVKDDGCPD
jgi:hypothetical protein